MTESNDCGPVCNPECQHGECVQPQTCLCNSGYEPESAALGHLCQPRCQVDCVNGTCSAPEQCSCLEGFVPSLQGNSSICQPNCSQGCQNGICVAPETCVCPAGYERASNGCHLSVDPTTQASSSSPHPSITASPHRSEQAAKVVIHNVDSKHATSSQTIVALVLGSCFLLGTSVALTYFYFKRRAGNALGPDQVPIIDL